MSRQAEVAFSFVAAFVCLIWGLYGIRERMYKTRFGTATGRSAIVLGLITIVIGLAFAAYGVLRVQ